MAFRGCIPDFQTANPLYIGATVSFFTVNASGQSTGTLATLFTDPTSATTALNPQTLDSEGKFTAPVYIEVPVIAQVTGPNVPSHATGVINPRGTWRGNWAAATIYYSTDFVADPVSGNIYIATQDYTSSSSLATDISAGDLQLVINQAAIISGGAALAIKVPVMAATSSADGNLALSGLITVDGYQTLAGDRILVNNQTNAAQNGLYNAASGAWTRTIDANASNMFANGCVVFVIKGTVNSNKGYQLSIASPFTLGTTAQNWIALDLPFSSIPVSLQSAPDGALAAGAFGYYIVPFACTISSVFMIVNTAGSIVMDVWRVPFASFPPTIANSITGADQPTITSAQSMSDSTLTGWTKTLNQGDVLAFVILSVSGVQRVDLELSVVRQ
jgi:hypothetical protein